MDLLICDGGHFKLWLSTYKHQHSVILGTYALLDTMGPVKFTLLKR